MRSLAVVAGALLCCIVGLTARGTEVVGAAGSSQAMYRAEVVGVLVALDRMYEAEEVVEWSGHLRVDEVLDGTRPTAGQVVVVEYEIGASGRGKAPRIGDQVRMAIAAEPKARGGELLWVASEGPEVMGRGDFIRPGEGAVVDLGPPGAKILVKMFAPLQPECHRKTAELLKELAAREPQRVRVQIFNMATPEGRKEMNREGISCATVLVNNRYTFTLVGPEDEREVAFHHRPNAPQSSYRSEDVVALVEQEIDRVYGQRASGGSL